jgi:(p)ppGpp synthase/HD superfamily hydrolase
LYFFRFQCLISNLDRSDISRVRPASTDATKSSGKKPRQSIEKSKQPERSRSDLIVRSRFRFAAAAHESQKRKYTGEPYVTHCNAVAEAVRAFGADEPTIAAAYLHYTREDTPTTYEDLVREFGREVADLVEELTKVYSEEAYPTLTRKERKAKERDRLAKVSPRAKLIKRADLAHNRPSIEKYDPEFFAAVWLPEMTAPA